MTRRCDDCGATVADTIGARQCSLFGPADPRIDPCAAESLRAGRILCPACARGVPLEPLDTPEAVVLELADGEADAMDEGPGPVPPPYDRARVEREMAEDSAFHARQRRGAKRNKNWRGDAKADAWDRARAAGRR